MDEKIFLPNENVVSNIEKLSKKLTLSCEMRLCEMHELTETAADFITDMIKEDYSVKEAVSLLTDFVCEKRYLPCDVMEENKHILDSFMTLVSSHDKVSFSSMLLTALKSRGLSLSESDFLEIEKPDDSIALVKGPLSGEAYDVFSEELREPRLRYVSDTKEAVAMVVGGEVGYCVLPFEERGGVRLSSISEQIFREELKINSVTPVFGPYGGADMKYALLSRCLTAKTVNVGDDRYLEIRISDSSSALLSELTVAANAFGLGVYRINTISLPTEDGDKRFMSLVFSVENRDFSDMLLYLTLFISEYTPVGIYKNLE